MNDANVLEKPTMLVSDASAVGAAIDAACARIAPTWPLDQFIAVNPYWGHLDRPIEDAAAKLACLSGAKLCMPIHFYMAEMQSGRMPLNHLTAALQATGSPLTAEQLLADLGEPQETPHRLPLLTDIADVKRDTDHAMPWRDFVTHQVSQHCAAYFDRSQAAWTPSRKEALYESWRLRIASDHSPALLMGAKGLAQRAKRLDRRPDEAVAAVLAAVGLPEEQWADYLSALLLSINGWASWCAHEAWQARLEGRSDDHLLQLLAIRAKWDWLLMNECRSDALSQWHEAWRDAGSQRKQVREVQQRDWIFQAALERAYQAPLCAQLVQAPDSTEKAPLAPPAVQAVFCIDVRSEVFRRALERSSEGVETKGFAGFFGLPIAYNPLGTEWTRPQLPGLLAPTLRVSDCAEPPGLAQILAARRQQRLQVHARWEEFRGRASSAFTFVETCGLFYAPKLLRKSMGSAKSHGDLAGSMMKATEVADLKPRLRALAAQGLHGVVDSRIGLAVGILRAMALTTEFARLVLLAGHGSQTTNNPHAAGLDCGACGGQSGEVNARVLAALLNEPGIREGVALSNIHIPPTTWFVAGLHNTTTDEVQLFDLDSMPDSHVDDISSLRAWLRDAGDRARAERSPGLGLGRQPPLPGSLLQRLKQRANNWAEVRPEWGLADNAAFVVAPRRRTRHLNLQGRVFLHDYDFGADRDGSILELIMTAPMVVTNWINMQYYASTVDPQRYGSGNKVLHNVVGGRLGVFEGNGGDLRIGLPTQTVHDGKRWRHTPLRLSVYIEASQAAISAVLHKHASVRHLVENRWLHLFQIDPFANKIARYQADGWKAAG